jgi:peroxiredoxin Q/BCP
MANVTEGAKAPDFELPTDDGGTLTLAALQGAGLIVVLYFYPKDDTPGYTNEARDFSALKPEFGKAGAVVIGVSKDTVAKHAKFRAKYDLTIALGSDPDGAVIQAYESWVPKVLYGREYMGIDRSTFLIDAQGVIRRIWRKVKVAGHAAEVLAAVKAL